MTDLCFALDELGCPPDLLTQVMQHTAWFKQPGTMEPDDAEKYFWGVRQYGGWHWTGGDRAGALPVKPPDNTEAP